jgi:hypothetical protein
MKQFCKCNLKGDRPNRPLFKRNGEICCKRCEKPVRLCSHCGGVKEPGVKQACDEEDCPELAS